MKEKDIANIFKAMGDKNRIEITIMLSQGELCACEILEKFNITQPTLSHHMKILCDMKIVTSRREGKWSYYSLNEETIVIVKEFMDFLLCRKERK